MGLIAAPRTMDYRYLITLIIILMIKSVQLSSPEGDKEMATTNRIIYENRADTDQEYRLYESYSYSSNSSGDSMTSIQNNVKINIDTNVHHINEDKVSSTSVLHQQHHEERHPPPIQKGQRQKLNKHGNEIINPHSWPMIAINRL